MTASHRRIVHVGGSAADARLVAAALAASREGYDVEWTATLSAGLMRVRHDVPAAVLLDVQPAHHLDTTGLDLLIAAVPDIPVVVIGARDDDAVAERFIRAGARDYLVTTRLDGYWLPRVLRQAIAAKKSDDMAFADTERLMVALSAMGHALLSTDTAGRITYLNASAEAMTGWSSEAAYGRPLGEVLQIVDATTRESAADRVANPGHHASTLGSNDVLLRRDGSESAVEHSAAVTRDRFGLVTGEVVVVRDISAAREMSARLSHLASHDPLTDLPNRMLLNDRLARALALARRYQRRLAVLFLDIDHFKTINDTLGHLLGDHLLKAVARAVTMCVRSSDTVSRQGGDEFVVLLSELEHSEDAGKGAQKIIGCLARPQRIGGHDLHVTVSIGISVFPDDGEDPETLMKRADMALYDAKDHGRDGYRFFKPALNVRAVERQSIEASLHNALDRGEFELHYQPKLNLKTRAVVGAEALIRWRHPARGLVEPGRFVSIAEDCGLIRPIGRWVIREACRQAREWQDSGLRPIPVAVNVSAVEFRSRDFLASITQTLAETALDPRFLEIELTESVLVGHLDSTNSVLHALKELGVQLAIDDFGIGWSGLSYLRDFPFDALKVDKSFVQEITAGSKAALIVSSLIGMGRSLNQRVIAEGVETDDQLAFLQAADCGEGQGYYFSPPLVAGQFARVLQARRAES